MNQLHLNTIANFFGKSWSALASLLFIPLYAKYLGIEAYGLIGFYAMLQAVLAFSDMGFGAAFTREMARLSVIDGRELEMRTLLRTLEVYFWLIAAALAGAVVLLAPAITCHWVNAHALSADTITRAVRLMGIALALVFPWSLYQGGLIGLQHQVLSNGILAVMVTLRAVGAVLILWLVSPTLEAFFGWQITVNTIQVVLAGWFAWRVLPDSASPDRVHNAALLPIWRYAAGMMGITIISTILTQMDKAVVSKMLPLELFGYYSLAAVISQVPSLFSGPVSSAVFPCLTQLVSLRDQKELSRLYHRTCQVVSVLVFSVGLTLAAFSKEIMLLWTGNPATAEHTYALASLFLIGSICLALQVIPFFLALANGWTSLNLILGIITIAVVIPLLFVLVGHYGSIGGAWAWIVINGGTLPVYIHFIHKRLLQGEEWQWYINDVGLPLSAALIPIVLGYWLIPASSSLLTSVGCIIVIGTASLLASSLAASEVRSRLIGYLARLAE